VEIHVIRVIGKLCAKNVVSGNNDLNYLF